MEQYSFEKLDIYKRSIDFASTIRVICRNIKTDYGILDQLKRAALSVSLNIAEGAGRYHKKDKKNFYCIARGSLYECIPILTILLREKRIAQSQYDELYLESLVLSKMLTRLIQSIDGPDKT